MQKYYSARQVCQSNKIYWIKSYKAVLKYMHQYEHILKPITTGGGDSSGRRYFVTEENLNKFVSMFEHNELS